MKTFTIALGMIFVSILYASPNVRRYTIGHALDIMEDLVEKRWPPHVATWSLSGNFAPIREERSFEVLVPIEGDVPKDIDGVFLRNGPNPQYEPKGGYHWFDGDGMIHAVSFENGTAAYVNRYIRTPRWTFENDHKGRTMYMKLGDMGGAGGLIKILVINSLRRLFGILPRDAPYHDGTANTNLLFWKDRLLALVENALPFRVYVGRDSNGPSVASVGYDSETFDFPIIAHPHVDQRTGELIALGYLLDQDTHDARYAVFDENGRRTTDFELRLEEKGMMHDFAITKRWSIVPEWSLAFKPKEMVQNGDVFSFDHNRNARLHVFPRHAASQEESKVYELDTPAFGFHVMNAFETDGGEIRMFACMTKNFSMSFHTESIVLYKFTIDPNADVVRRDVVYDRHNIEFVRVRDDLFGHVTQYGYGVRFTRARRRRPRRSLEKYERRAHVYDDVAFHRDCKTTETISPETDRNFSDGSRST